MERSATPATSGKDHLPEAAADHLPRPRLARRLGGSGSPDIVLVCAPSGFGKTALVARWAQEEEHAVAWLRLDAGDGDGATFARRVVAALRTVAPGAGERTERLLRKRRAVASEEYGRSLLADLKPIETRFTLVLDDYSSLAPGDVHDVTREVLRHLPANMRMVLIARYDPPLALQDLLVAGRASEIRQRELAFTAEETAAFLEQQVGWVPDPQQLERLVHRLDGWPTGLRLLAQGLDDPAARGRIVERLPEGVLRAQRYLCAELFDRLENAHQDLLLRCSLLDAFTSELCAALADGEGEELTPVLDPEWHGTFVAAVDERPSWFRVSSLFHEFLEDRRRARFDADLVRTLHDRAAAWFSEHCHVVEALDHALQGHEPTSAAGMLADHRIRLINEGRSPELFQAMQRLPAEVIDSSLDTILLRVWAAPPEVFQETVSRVESMLAQEAPPADRVDAVRGELRLMQAGNLMSLSMGDTAGLSELVACAKEALDLLPSGFAGARALAYHVLAQALQFQGELRAADAALDRGVAEFAVGGAHPLSIIHYTRALIHLMEADPVTVRDAVLASLACELVVPPETEPYRLQVRRLLCQLHYQWNELDEAARVLDRPEGRSHLVSLQLLAQVRQAQGREAEASELMEAAVARAAKAGGRTSLLHAHAQAAQLALHQGRVADALRWAEGARTEEARPFHSALSTSLIRAEVLIRAGEARHRETAADLLESMDRAAQQVNLRKYRINILALQSLLCSAAGDEDGAFSALGRSLTLASRGRHVRAYLDLGSDMRSLLARFPAQSEHENYVTELREAFTNERIRTSGRVSPGLPDPLSDREIDVLVLMGERYSNKEIARKLHVSVLTVKSHAIRIYQKLHVHSRREAVEKARALGVLPEA